MKHAARNTRKEGMETLTWRQQLMLKVIAGAREKGYLEVNCGIDAQQQVDLAKKRKKVKNKFKREAEPETLADDVQGPLRKPLEGAAGDATGEEADADSGHGDSAQLSQAPAAVGGSGVGAGAGGETAKEKGGLTEGMMPGENYQQFSKRLRAQTTKLLQQQVQAETAQAGMSERRKRCAARPVLFPVQSVALHTRATLSQRGRPLSVRQRAHGTASCAGGWSGASKVGWRRRRRGGARSAGLRRRRTATRTTRGQTSPSRCFRALLSSAPSASSAPRGWDLGEARFSARLCRG